MSSHAENSPAGDAEAQLSALDTEAINPVTKEIDRMSPLEIAAAINAEDAKIADAVQKELPQIATAIEKIAARLRQGGRLMYIGAGTSGRLGVLDASECPPTFSVSPDLVTGLIAGGPEALTSAIENAEDNAQSGRADLEQTGVSARDAVVGIAASGRTPYVLGAIACAREHGALTIGLACNWGAPLEQVVDIMIAPIVGPEVITGSTRMKAGTAQKMVLNMLSTGAMILLGKTYGNLMVDVRATNYKLRRRAVEIVRRATELSQAESEALLRVSDGDVKIAILVGLRHVEPAVARERLIMHRGVLRAALESF